MSTVSHICDTLGRQRIAASLGVKTAAVSNAVSAGVFPSGWYLGLSEMCVSEGIDCPLACFNWRSPSATAAPESAAQ